MRKTKIKLSEAKVNGRLLFCVTWPKIGTGRNRQFFKDKVDAKRCLVQKRIEQENYGTAGFALNERQRVEYLECADLLRPFGGRTLRDAVGHFVSHLEANERSIGAAALVEEVIAAKESNGASERYIQDLRSRLPRFAQAFGGQMVSTISTMQIDEWLGALPVGPTTRNNYRRVLVTLFSFALKHKYTTSNPVVQTQEANEVDAPPGILTVAQVARLLECATPDILPYIAIGLFAGLRRAEIERLDYSEIDFDSGLIEVTAKNAKTARRRHVTMQTNLHEWLLPLRKHKGKVTGENFQQAFDQARNAAGIDKWPDNALRHSFASYHLAHFKNAAALALEMGHTNEGMIFRHYRELVKPNDAERYWETRPATVEKIVPLVASN